MTEPPVPDRIKRLLRICGIFLVVAMGLALLSAAVVWAPQRLVDEGKTRANSDRPALSANEQVTAENSVRTTLVQAFGGLILVVGATFTLRQLQISRAQLRVSSAQQDLATELGRATLEASRKARTDETWTKAVDQLGASSWLRDWAASHPWNAYQPQIAIPAA
jgi:hypothetical protein